MHSVYEAKVFWQNIVIAILCFAATISLGLEMIPAFSGGYAHLKLFAPAIFLFEGVASLLSAKDMKKGREPRRISKKTGIYMLAALPAYLTFGVFFALVLPISYPQPIYWVNLVLTGLVVGARIYQVISLSREFAKPDHDGLLPFRNLALFSLAFSSLVFIFYLLAFLKFHGVLELLAEIGTKPTEEILRALPLNYVIPTVIVLVLDLITLFFVLYLGLSTLVSGIEDKAMDLKKNFGLTKALIRKYNIVYWLSTLMVFLFFLAALVGAITQTSSGYIALAVLYGTVLGIRIPAYFWNRAVQNAHRGDYYATWRAKHKIMIYAGAILGAYVIGSSFLGSVTTNPGAMRGALFTFAIFTPWAIIKAVLGVRSLIRAENLGDPFLEVNGNLDITLALLTLANSAFLVADATDQPFAVQAGVIFTALIAVHAMYVSVKVFLRGIRGVLGKRIVIYQRHEKAFIRYVDSYDLIAATGLSETDQAIIKDYDRGTKDVINEATRQNKTLERHRSVSTILLMIATLVTIFFVVAFFGISLVFFTVDIQSILDLVPAETTATPEEVKAALPIFLYTVASILMFFSILGLVTILFASLSSHRIQYNQPYIKSHATLLVLSILTFHILMAIAAVYALIFASDLEKANRRNAEIGAEKPAESPQTE